MLSQRGILKQQKCLDCSHSELVTDLEPDLDQGNLILLKSEMKIGLTLWATHISPITCVATASKNLVGQDLTEIDTIQKQRVVCPKQL